MQSIKLFQNMFREFSFLKVMKKIMYIILKKRNKSFKTKINYSIRNDSK